MSEEKVLIIDDEENLCISIYKTLLNFQNIESDYVLSPSEALEKLKENEYGVILLDYKIPQMTGFELYDEIVKNGYTEKTKVVLMTAHGDTEMGIEAIDKGFFDYIAKPFNSENLIFRVTKAIEFNKLNEKVEMLSCPLSFELKNVIGNSPEMNKVFKLVHKIADKDAIALIEGETGTGKELIARAIHEYSSRKKNIFLPVNCGALTESLLESELFGHEKGSFTGAVNKKFGILEAGNSGTVFLDEINNASFNVQLKLLRFIETGEFIRVGGNCIIKSDTRIVAATNQSLEEMVSKKTFREDLFHRLNIVKILLPPLRKRKGDITLLIKHFQHFYNKKLNKKVHIYKKAMECLMKYNWPGNVRELQNTLHSLILLNETGSIKPENLPANIKRIKYFIDNVIAFKKLKNTVVTDFEVEYLKMVLEDAKGNVSRASEISKINRQTFIEKLRQYDIDPSSYKIKK